MPLLLPGQTEGWKLHLRLTDSSWLRADPTNNVRFAGNTAVLPLNVSNASTHLFQSDGTTHICASVHGRNTRRLSSTTVSIDGASSSSLPVPTASCPLLLSFFTLEEVVTSNAQIHAYNGSSESTPMPGVMTFLAEGGVTNTWLQAETSSTPLALVDQSTPDVEHNFYIAISVEATGSGSGLTTGALKVSLSYV